jgi:hypothetical protein
MPPCVIGLIAQATIMRRTAGIKNKIRTRVARREKRSDLLPRRAPAPTLHFIWILPNNYIALCTGGLPLQVGQTRT